MARTAGDYFCRVFPGSRRILRMELRQRSSYVSSSLGSYAVAAKASSVILLVVSAVQTAGDL